VHKAYNTFQEAFDVYADAYRNGKLQVRLLGNSPFYKAHVARSGGGSDADFWDQVDDLSTQFSQVGL
jgi:hypothetical protein